MEEEFDPGPPPLLSDALKAERPYVPRQIRPCSPPKPEDPTSKTKWKIYSNTYHKISNFLVNLPNLCPPHTLNTYTHTLLTFPKMHLLIHFFKTEITKVVRLEHKNTIWGDGIGAYQIREVVILCGGGSSRTGLYSNKTLEYKMGIAFVEKGTMNIPKGFHYLVGAISGRYIYSLGGQNKGGNINTAERYDTLKGSWDLVPDLHYKRIIYGACIYNTYIYAYGLFFSSCFERLDTSCIFEGWTLLKITMPKILRNSHLGIRASVQISNAIIIFASDNEQINIIRFNTQNNSLNLRGSVDSQRVFMRQIVTYGSKLYFCPQYVKGEVHSLHSFHRKGNLWNIYKYWDPKKYKGMDNY